MDVRIYYEDTDSGGVVYHANYIKYMERARTEFFRNHGFLVAELALNGNVFPVVRMEIDFKAPAFHDDLLSIITTPVRTSGSSATMSQKIVRHRDGTLLVEGLITLACIGLNHKARRIPVEIRNLLENELKKSEGKCPESLMDGGQCE
ncbi:MAG: YbgC/FadM family acyl-CoA thioesterase [Desulfuromonadaceae bacterium]|nr:YbgC/FadM family acyl-CoA thioesterase [Desulfuromonadaceae bacterium]MDD5104238.1 YbgC/FadM family acyl-CoA thioesterase [Desulfuromonadaceae bacterium]